MSRKKQIYMIVEKNEYELPVHVGTTEEICDYLEICERNLWKAVQKESTVDSKYYIIKIDGYKEVSADSYNNHEKKVTKQLKQKL
ncbi:hypothetical protein [Erysipelothrix rhusiopathiae]|uniref:hypothetical protein n=1 Tax=Erysipelothrix rhusiopathiae TaxID=1648 RepID=UPI00283AABC0|nr:hypothetical protein [Erysipelothrix rhusiopathiae]MDV7678438.1 hypothetical protein [Erysipelothrix rhusiopathiae]WMT70138.1 hypothetical protein K0H77_01110 [Erysipelothrix rhusiopathiae]